MDAPPPSNSQPFTFRHQGRDLVLVPGKQLLAYALKRGPAPYFPPAIQEDQDDTHGGWGQPIFVHGSGDEFQDEDDSGGWGEPISRHGGGDEGDEDEPPTGQDVPEAPFQWGHIDEYGVGHGCIDLVWALDGVPSWDGAKHNDLSEESKRLIEAVAAVNGGSLTVGDRSRSGEQAGS